MSDQHWTCDQITSAAETQIASYMDTARRYALAQDTVNQSHNENLAFGAFLLWRQLTKGVRPEADTARMAKLLGMTD